MAKEFNYPVHAFRGFAILNVVAIHAFALVLVHAELTQSPAGWSRAVLSTLNSVLMHDATLYFTYISGILFSMILAKRGFARFYRSKFLYVFLPYVFFTVLYTARVSKGPFGTPSTLFAGTPAEFAQQVGMNLLTGTASLIFWYIPVLLVLYLLTPLLARLIALPGHNWLKALIVFAPLVFSRVWPVVSWTNYVYFLGAYLAGMIVGRHYRETLQLIRTHRTLLLITAVVTSIAVAAAGHFKVPVYGFTYVAESAWYLQKLAFAGLVLLWFENTMTRVPKWLDVLGNYAFALFFIHGFLAFQLVIWMSQYKVRFDSSIELLSYLVLSFVFALGGSVFLTYLGKRLLGKYSRYFLGA